MALGNVTKGTLGKQRDLIGLPASTRTRWPLFCQMGPKVSQGLRMGPERTARVPQVLSVATLLHDIEPNAGVYWRF
jgi:hypothetical protein